jgi:hypothetical protein
MKQETRGIIGGGLSGLLVGSFRQFYTHLYDSNLTDNIQNGLEEVSKRNLSSLGELALYGIAGATIGYGLTKIVKFYDKSREKKD